MGFKQEMMKIFLIMHYAIYLTKEYNQNKIDN